MDRRSLLRLASALPFLGWLKPKPEHLRAHNGPYAIPRFHNETPC